jgi:hypothetical protein
LDRIRARKVINRRCQSWNRECHPSVDERRLCSVLGGNQNFTRPHRLQRCGDRQNAPHRLHPSIQAELTERRHRWMIGRRGDGARSFEDRQSDRQIEAGPALGLVGWS